MIWIRISKLRSPEPWCIKGTNDSTLGKDSSVPVMQHDPNYLETVILIQILLSKQTPNVFQSETSQNTTDGKGNYSDQGDKSPARKLKAVNGESNNANGSLNRTDGLAEHTYASLNKPSDGKNSSGTIQNNNNAGYIAMTAPVPNRDIDKSGDRRVGGDSKTKADSGYSDVNSARAGKGGEVRKLRVAFL